ncbi:hypothetical protein N7U66_03350 [Lacinutrix neustonica]|uniref:Uncharacterized protein n=1 Tax=Lacinutrix neustonica TaxID=2980107 RepID=A0A9E8SHI3_9FLAO|nr:hypothetical protein [Lacinutrix neustonica]WAC02720.1 hypothetical protein N7U66_03350 [Lacinutrix neustonica]
MKEAKNIDIEKLFIESKGAPIAINGKEIVGLDRFKMISKKMRFNLILLETNSQWKQGFVLKTKGTFKIEGRPMIENVIVFWEDTMPQNIEVTVDSKDKTLLIYNVWDVGDGVMHYWHNGAAIEVKQENENKRIYHCNDGYPDLDFNDLIFSISW